MEKAYLKILHNYTSLIYKIRLNSLKKIKIVIIVLSLKNEILIIQIVFFLNLI